jgi:hypothetical protein
MQVALCDVHDGVSYVVRATIVVGKGLTRKDRSLTILWRYLAGRVRALLLLIIDGDGVTMSLWPNVLLCLNGRWWCCGRYT